MSVKTFFDGEEKEKRFSKVALMWPKGERKVSRRKAEEIRRCNERRKHKE